VPGVREAGAAAARRQALELRDPRVLERDPEAADLAPARRRLARRLQRAEGRDRIHREAHAVDRTPHLPDQPRRLRRGDAGERRLLLDQQHVALAGLGQAPGDSAADRPAADDHDLRVPQLAHRFPASAPPQVCLRRTAWQAPLFPSPGAAWC
jgi:hypothetical protein